MPLVIALEVVCLVSNVRHCEFVFGIKSITIELSTQESPKVVIARSNSSNPIKI